MRLDIITLFSGAYWGPLEQSIPARARDKGLVEINIVNLRDFTSDNYGTVDDRPFGGGAGMVLKPEPLFDAVQYCRTDSSQVVLLTPQGRRFNQGIARELSAAKHLIMICGHYEGVDERVRQTLVDHEISIGDYILSNGNLAAMVVADALIRLLPGALGCAESCETESFGADGLLDFPQYTRPAMFREMAVPEVLLCGDHARIKAWRHEQKRVRTVARRPDLVQNSLETEQ